MGTQIFDEFKKQASVFFKEKIKTARLVLTDVTPVELLTDEATKGNMLSPDAHSMGVISRAAFEVDDYWRIVDILHKRLSEFNRKNWRASYNALIVLEHMLTHGPLRVSDEFQSDIGMIEEMESFEHVDEEGFNWGSSVRKLSQRILKLLRNRSFLREERERTRKLTIGIKGFGRSFTHITSTIEEGFDKSRMYGRRCNSGFLNHRIQEENDVVEENQIFLSEEDIRNRKPEQEKLEAEHPFCKGEQEGTESLLPAT